MHKGDMYYHYHWYHIPSGGTGIRQKAFSIVAGRLQFYAFLADLNKTGALTGKPIWVYREVV